MTPFDVIKTRLQTQASPEPLFRPSSMSPPGITCCQPNQIADKTGPLCQHDPRVESRASSSRAGGNSARGLGHHDHLTAHRAARVLRFSPQASNGMAAIACAFPDKNAAIRELERTRNSGEGRLAGLWDGVVKVGRSEGLKGLWRGLTPTL